MQRPSLNVKIHAYRGDQEYVDKGNILFNFISIHKYQVPKKYPSETVELLKPCFRSTLL